MFVPKNTAGTRIGLYFYHLTTGGPITTGTPTGTRVIDGGTASPLTGTFAYVADGMWLYTTTAADTNGARINAVFQLAGAYSVALDLITYDVLTAALTAYNASAEATAERGRVADAVGVEIEDGVEGTVAASPTPTPTVFGVEGLPNTSTAFGNQYTVILSGALDGVAKPNSTFAPSSATAGLVTLGAALPAAPASGVRVRIVGYRGA